MQFIQKPRAEMTLKPVLLQSNVGRSFLTKLASRKINCSHLIQKGPFCPSNNRTFRYGAVEHLDSIYKTTYKSSTYKAIPRLPRASVAPLMCGEVLVDALLTLKPGKQDLKGSTLEPCKLQSYTVPSIVGGYQWDV